MANEKTNATETTEAKAPTLATRLKYAVVDFIEAATAAGFDATNPFKVKGVTAEQINALFALRNEIGEGRSAQSLEDRMAAVSAEIDEHFASIPLDKNGRPAPDAEYKEKTLKLLARQARVQRSIDEGGDHPEPKGEKGESANA